MKKISITYEVLEYPRKYFEVYNLKMQLKNISATIARKLQEKDYEVDEYEVYVKHEEHTAKFDLYITACNVARGWSVELIRKDGHDTSNVEKYIADWLQEDLYNDFSKVESDLAKEDAQREAEAEFDRAWQMWDNLTH